MTRLYKLKPHRFFFVSAFVWGMLMMVLTPPFQVPDEVNHFYRAYHVSQGNFMATRQNDRVGGVLPASLKKITDPLSVLTWNSRNKTNKEQITELFRIPLQPEQTDFFDFPNTALYSPVSYAPQATAIFMLRSAGLPPLYIFYGARFLTLLFWMFMIGFAIRIIPIYKWLFTLLALLPMSVFVNMSLSADVVTNALSFVLIAFVFRLAYGVEKVSGRQFLAFLLLAALLASAKLVYAPLILLFMIIPAQKSGSTKKHYMRMALLFFTTLAVLLSWSVILGNLYINYNSYNEKNRDLTTIMKCADKDAQLHYILNHGCYIFDVFGRSVVKSFDMYFEGYIGTFGWLDTYLPGWLIWFSYAVILYVACSTGSRKINIKPIHKLIALAIVVLVSTLVLLTQHLIWDCVGGDLIRNLQGRYFIPAFPLLFVAGYNRAFRRPLLSMIAVVGFSVIVLSYSTYVIYKRYYIADTFESVRLTCDAEKVSGENLFATNLPGVFVEGANTRTNAKHRSGNYSALLTPQQQFAFTYRLYNCSRGDVITASVWRYGKAGHIVISGEGGRFYTTQSEPVLTDSSGWELVQLELIVPNDMNKKETGIYYWNNSPDSCYLDDMTIGYEKLK